MNPGPAPDLRAPLTAALAAAAGTSVEVRTLRRLAGGASQEAWRVDAAWQDADGAMADHSLVVRRALGGRMFEHALGREAEFGAIALAHAHGVAVPQPYWYLPDVADKPAFVMQCLDGETVGRRIVRDPALAGARAVLAAQMGTQLGRIHAIPLDQAAFLPGPGANETPLDYSLRTLTDELTGVEEPYPAIELALAWLRRHAPRAEAADGVTCHGDFRVGNVVVAPHGLVGVLDWEFAHRGPRGADLAFGAIRAWRFGAVRALYGGVGTLEAFIDAYNAAAGQNLTAPDLYYWEVHANVKWAIATVTQARRHLSGAEPSMELASLGRMTAEIELETISLLDPAHPRYPY